MQNQLSIRHPLYHLPVVLSAAVLLLVTGCKLHIGVPPNGLVTNASGTYTCAGGQTCVIDVTDLFFDETFTAVPDAGYEFNQWKKAPYRFCGGYTVPCRLFTSSFEGLDRLLAILESDEVFYLEPVFVPRTPETATNSIHGQFVGYVTVDGVNRFGHALLTEDGFVELFVGGPSGDEVSTGLIEVPSQATDFHVFSGRISSDGNASSGTGMLIHLGNAEFATIRVNEVDAEPAPQLHTIRGEITTGDGSLQFDLDEWGYYNIGAALESIAGQYSAPMKMYGSDLEDIPVTIDETGHIMVENMLGCDGHGEVTPHGNGEHFVFDVTLTFDCSDYHRPAPTGEYHGHATLAPGSFWGYDGNLQLWATKSSPRWDAFSLWGLPAPEQPSEVGDSDDCVEACCGCWDY